MEYKNIILEDVGAGVTLLKINRPKALNALNSETLLEMNEVLKTLEDDPLVRVIVLTGEGDKAFIAGADIAEMKEKSINEGVSFARFGQQVTKRLELIGKPTIAAVQGFALGGGTEMAISCDFIIASEKAVFGQPEVGLGIIPGFGATLRLAKFVGVPLAKDLIFSGRKINAQEALRVGLVNRLLPHEGFLMAVIEIAKQISAQSAPAIKVSKKLLNEFSEINGLDYKLDAEAQEFGALFGSRDQTEGMGAFLEKRKPNFEGTK